MSQPKYYENRGSHRGREVIDGSWMLNLNSRGLEGFVQVNISPRGRRVTISNGFIQDVLLNREMLTKTPEGDYLLPQQYILADTEGLRTSIKRTQSQIKWYESRLTK